MTSSLMIEGHIASLKERVRLSTSPYLVVAQDTTHYNYSGHKSMTGIGKSSEFTLGILQHNALVLEPTGLSLGVVDQQYWSRGGTIEYQGVESQKWIRGLGSVNKELSSLGKQLVVVQDREADIFEFFKSDRKENVDIVCRVCQNRNFEVESDGAMVKLPEISDHLSRYGEKKTIINRSGKEIELTLELSAGKVNVCSTSSKKVEGLSLVVAKVKSAVDLKTGAIVMEEGEPSVWYLLTSLPIESHSDIVKIVDCYSLRWSIERFHFALKSGSLNVERLQFDDIETMINALSFYSIIAWQCIYLLHWTRLESDSPVEVVMGKAEVEILEKVSGKTIKTVKEGIVAMAKIVGFAPSRRQPMPGIKILSIAIERFYYMVLGAEIYKTG